MSKNKYHVAPAEERTSEGIVFHSKREMQHYQQFRALEKCGAILKLERQVKFPLLAATPWPAGQTERWKPVPVSKYIADFVVTDKEGMAIYDSKGHRTAEYKRTKKWFEACYPHLRIVEI